MNTIPLLRYLSGALLALPLNVLAGEEPLTLLASSSLRGVLPAIGALYEKETGLPIRYVFDATGALARQLEQGAPADIFLAADPERLDALAAQQRIDATTRRTLARVRLAILQPAPHDVFIETPADLLRVDKVAVGDPTVSAAGHHARAALEQLSLWERLQPNVLLAADGAAATTLAERDQVGAALAFESDARLVTTAPGVRVSCRFDREPVPVEAAITAEAPRRVAAMKFFWVLEMPEAKALWAQHGFLAP